MTKYYRIGYDILLEESTKGMSVFRFKRDGVSYTTSIDDREIALAEQLPYFKYERILNRKINKFRRSKKK